MMPDPGTVCAGQSVGFKASASLRMAEAALSLTVGPSTARLDISAATSGRSNTMGSMTDTNENVDRFFERYASALLARDAKAMAAMYAVPSLLLFPGQSIPVSDANQTEEFFASSWGQYEGVDAVDKQIVVMGEAPGSVWADVTWSYGGQPRERFCYQLVEGTEGYQVAVLTPMA